MTIQSAVIRHRVARTTCLFLSVALCLCTVATAQLPLQAPVPVMAGSYIPFNHGSTGQWGQIFDLIIAHNGSVLFLDAQSSYLYQLAPGASTPFVVVGPTASSANQSNGSTLEASGTYWNSGMAVDANDTLYVTDRYGSSTHFFRVPYDAAKGTWVFGSTSAWGGTITLPNGSGGTTGVAFSSQAIAIDDQGNLIVSGSKDNEIIKIPVDPITGNQTAPATILISNMKSYASSVAVDHAGNVYFIENAFSDPSARVTGVRVIPAGKSGLVGDGSGSIEGTLARVDPASAGFNFRGITVDAAGNLYLSTIIHLPYGSYASMVLMVPNEDTPTAPNLVWNDSVQISPVGAGYPVAIDPRGYIWIPNGGASFIPPSSPTDYSTQGVVLWVPGTANLGSTPIGTAGATGTVFYSFNSTVTPGSFTFAQGGKASDFSPAAAITPPTGQTEPIAPCATGTTYQSWSSTESGAVTSCAYYVALTPMTAGGISGELQMLDSNNKVIAGSNVYLNGVGQGPEASILAPALEVLVASGLSTPKQVAGDSFGNSYVADPGLGAVKMYAPGSSSAAGTLIGTDLTAPTGIAVDGAGDVYIGDSGNVIMIPFIKGALDTAAQTTLLTSLGDNLNLAVDGSGNVYVADYDNKRVVKISNPAMQLTLADRPLNTIGAGVAFTGPSAIATDSSGDVFVADGSNLWELPPVGGEIEITSSLSAPVTGLAVDASSSLFVAQSGGLIWIPYDSTTGGLNINGAVSVASDLATELYGVALDGLENVYVSYGSAGTAGMTQLGIGGSLNFGQIIPYVESDAEAQIFNLGNAPLTLSAFSADTFTGPNVGDYSVGTPSDSPACDPSTPTTPGQFCYFDIALTPSSTGPSSASVAIMSNAANGASVNLALSATAVIDTRPATQTAISIQPSSGINYPGSVTIDVAVNSVSNSATPIGIATLSVTGHAKTAANLQNGVATFTFSNLLGGTYKVTADYGGNGTDFAVSSAGATFTVKPATPVIAVAAPKGSITVAGGVTYVRLGTSTTITASVTSSVGTPTGSVTFMQGGQPADPSQSAIALDANGSATFNTTNLAAGKYSLTVVYGGDRNFASVTSVPITFQVVNPTILISASPAAGTLTAGTPGQITLTLQPIVGFDAQVNVECVTSTLPPNSECTFDNPSIAVGANATAPSTTVVTISTNVPVNVSRIASPVARQAPWSLAGLFGFGLFGLLVGRRRSTKYLTMICFGLVLLGALKGITACTNAGFSTPPPAPRVTTPSGTYNVSIITVNPATSLQDSLPFTLPVTVK